MNEGDVDIRRRNSQSRERNETLPKEPFRTAQELTEFNQYINRNHLSLEKFVSVDSFTCISYRIVVESPNS